MLSALDGVVTGIAIGPELLLLSEWPPQDGWASAGFADEAEAKDILGTVDAEILSEIANDVSDPYFRTATAGSSQPPESKDSCRRS